MGTGIWGEDDGIALLGDGPYEPNVASTLKNIYNWVLNGRSIKINSRIEQWWSSNIFNQGQEERQERMIDGEGSWILRGLQWDRQVEIRKKKALNDTWKKWKAESGLGIRMWGRTVNGEGSRSMWLITSRFKGSFFPATIGFLNLSVQPS